MWNENGSLGYKALRLSVRYSLASLTLFCKGLSSATPVHTEMILHFET